MYFCSFEEVHKKYMDKTSREVLEQAAKEYYTDLKRSKYDADESVQGRSSQNRYFYILRIPSCLILV